MFGKITFSTGGRVNVSYKAVESRHTEANMAD